MGIDNFAPATETAEEGSRARKRQLTQQAIGLAMQSRWQEAADANRDIVELASNDAEAYNRLGKACTELGEITGAREAYESALQVDPANLIAQRNLERLSRMTEAEAADLAKKASQKLDPQFFMEETGKTGVTVLQDVTESEGLRTLTAGDEVALLEQNGALLVTTLQGGSLGRVEDQLSGRLTRLMQSGNEYRAGVVGVDGRTVRVIIRETQQAPDNAGRISFPPRVSQDSLPRPYVKEGLLRRSGDEDEDDDVDMEGDSDTDDEEEDTAEFGFHEGTLGES